MKKNIFIAILIILSMPIILNSCLDKALDVEPENSVTYTNFFSEPGEIESAVYAMVGDLQLVEDDIRYYGTVQADWDNMDSRSQKEHNLDPESFANSYCTWERCYISIFYANTILQNMGNAKSLSEDSEKFYKGQCYFTLGWTYYYLAINWGEAPIITEPRNFVKVYAKSSSNELLDEAIKYTEEAIKLLENWEDLKKADGSPVSTKQIAGKGTAYTLLAHIYAWKASMNNNDTELYKKAIDAADEVIEGRAGNYQLLDTPEEVCTKVISDQETTEEIFVQESNIIDRKNASPAFSSGYINYPVDPAAIPSDIINSWVIIHVNQIHELYSNNDLRKTSYFYKVNEYSHPDSVVMTSGFAFTWKWRNVIVDGTPPYTWIKSVGGDGIIWRLPELILLRGECKSRIGDATAVEDLNIVRRRAGLGDYAGEDGADIRYAITKEYDREFIFEPGRYYWYVRNGYYKLIGGGYAKLTEEDVKKGALYLPVTEDAFYNNPYMLQNQYWLEKF